MKLGLIYCLNRPTQLYHITEPIFDKKKLTENEAYLRQINSEGEYVAMQPRFSTDFSKLAYIGRDEKFISHSGNYELKLIKWPGDSGTEVPPSEVILPRMKEYPADDSEYCGLFGYNVTYTASRFLGDSAKFFVLQSEFKGQDRQYVVDVETK
jgi:hypothetical protein